MNFIKESLFRSFSHFNFVVGFCFFSASVFAQPANDNPCNATPLTAGPSCTYVSATNVGATSTPGVPAPGCASYSNNDVWFSVVVPAGGSVNIDSNTGTMTDGGMAVYTGTCSSMTLLDCDDDSSPNGSMPQIALNSLTPGTTIFVRFWKYGGGTGTFSICATAPEPAPACGSSPAAGNTCATATPICDLNGYCGNTSASYTANSWSQSCGFLGLSDCGLTGEFCGSIENNSFLSFVASGTSISFDVWVNSSTLGYGIQIFIFSASGGCSGTVTQYGPCYNPGVVEPGPVNITATGLTAGNTYYIMIDGNSGDVCNYTIGANSGVSLPVSISPATATICEGETVPLTASGGNGTYTWNTTPQLNTTTGANVIATPPGPGTYTYTANSTTGNAACPSATSATATITVNPCGGCTVTAGNSGPICSGNTVNLTATNVVGATFSWTGPAGFTSSSQNVNAVIVPTAPGTYTYTVTATVGGQTCTSTTDVVVNALPIVFAGADISICSGDNAVLTATGASSYSWSPLVTNGVPFVPSSSATYTVTGTSSAGCVSTDDILVTVNSCGCSVLADNSGAVCSGGTVDLTATTVAGASYSWSGPSGFSEINQNVSNVILPIAAGIYSYTVIATVGALSCTSTTNVEVYANPIINAGTDVSICEGESVTLTASGASVYSWSPVVSNGIAFVPLSSGTYIVTGTDSQGCIGTDQVDVTVSLGLTVDAGSDITICEGEEIVLTAVGASNFTWTPSITNGTPFVPLTSGVYSVVGTNVSGCIGTDELTVTVNSIPAVNAGNDVVVCQGESVILTGTGASNYSWSPNVTNGVAFVPSVSGVYTVTGTLNGCSNQDDVLITINPTPLVDFSADVVLGCAPLTVTFTNNSAVSTDCNWNFGNGEISANCGIVTTTYTQAGCYDVLLTVESAGCESSLSILDFICVEEDPVASFSPSTSIVGIFDSEIQFTNSSIGAINYNWTFDNGGGLSNLENPSYIFPSVPGNYNTVLIAYSSLGCSDTAYATIVVNEELIFYVPNTFTPDNDAFNPTFLPVFTSGFDPFDYMLRIYNRWGELIFESHDVSVGWDGSYGDSGQIEICQDGTYTWKIEFKTSMNDERKSIQGHLNLIR